MPLTLLPASAAAFAPRSAPNIVLASRPEVWLTHTLKRVNKVKRPLNNVNQHQRCLNELLAGPSAIWALASLMLPKSPDNELKKDSNPLIEALFNYQMLSIEAYVVHVDMVSQHEVAFKLTQDTIDSLIEYHTDIFSVDTAAATNWKWPEKDAHLKKLQEEFKQAINRYVYRTDARALEGLEEDGAGELLEGRSLEVKEAITGFFLPLLPPPPKLVEVVRPQPVYQLSAGHWYYPVPASAPPHTHLTAPDPWKVLGSTPSPTTTTAETFTSPWSTSGAESQHSLSPASSYGQPYSAAGYYSSPQEIVPAAPLPLPSAIASQCGSSAAAPGNWSGLVWGQSDLIPQTPIFI